MTRRPIAQIAYFVPDVRAAALEHSQRYGSGPFFVVGHIPHVVMRGGRNVPFDHTAAVGQWGSIQLEIVQQDTSGPSIFHDVYPEGSGRYGIHHVGIFVDDLEEATAEYVVAGHREVSRLTPHGVPITAVFLDTLARDGHFTELFERSKALTDMHAMVRAAAEGWDGSDPVRSLML